MLATTTLSKTLAAGITAGLAVLAVPSAAQAAPVVVNPPAPGTCWDVAVIKAGGPTIYPAAPVSCTTAHTIETAANLKVPSGIAAKGNNSRDLHVWLDAQCQVKVNEYAGVSDPKTAAGGTRTWSVWLAPTQKDWKAGNHWVSCAAGAVPTSANGANSERLVQVRTSIANSPQRNQPRTFVSDSLGKGLMVGRKALPDLAGQPYPGTAGLQKTAWSFCFKVVGSNKYFWYGPSEADWLQGWTAITCYQKTK